MNLELVILRQLNLTAPYQMPEQTLRLAVALAFDVPVDDRDIAAATERLEGKRQIIRVPDEDREALFEIAPSGIARLAKNNLAGR